MSDRTKLTMVCLVVMLLPYRIDIPTAFLLLTATICAALDAGIESWGRIHASRSFISLLYRRLKYRPLSDLRPATD